MMDLRALYQEVIVDHNRHPRNFGELNHCDCVKEGHNPLCGDSLTLYLRFEGDSVVDLAFKGQGCAISTASASLMTEIVKGKTRAEAMALFARFHDMVTADGESASLDKLAVLAGVKAFPARIKCATLAWHTLRAALDNDTNTQVTTE